MAKQIKHELDGIKKQMPKTAAEHMAEKAARLAETARQSANDPLLVSYYAKIKNNAPQAAAEPQMKMADYVAAIQARGQLFINLDRIGSPKDFIVDKQNRMAIEMLVLYFRKSPKFEAMGEGYSLQKGIMLMGEVGRGKTLLLRLFTEIPLYFKQQIEYKTLDDLRKAGWPDDVKFKSAFRFTQFVSCKQIEMEYARKGFEALERYTTPAVTSEKMEASIYCFDDLGAENCEAVYFGNKVNLMSDIMMSRYELFLRGIITHCTTNLSPQDLQDRYGERIRSRFREMFNVIKIGGNDRRK